MLINVLNWLHAVDYRFINALFIICYRILQKDGLMLKLLSTSKLKERTRVYITRA